MSPELAQVVDNLRAWLDGDNGDPPADVAADDSMLRVWRLGTGEAIARQVVEMFERESGR